MPLVYIILYALPNLYFIKKLCGDGSYCAVLEFKRPIYW